MSNLQRAIKTLVVAPIAGYHGRERYRQVEGNGERIQEVSFTARGTATPRIHWSSYEVTFGDPFYYAPGQRDNNFDTPVFGYGVLGTWKVMVDVKVEAWTRSDPELWFTGAILRVGIHTPEQRRLYGTCEIHCRFTGYGGPSEDSEGT